MTALEVALAVFVVVTALLTAVFRDLIGAVTTFAAFSLGISVVWLLLAAPDVALTEAAVGAGVMAMLLLVALVRTAQLLPERRSDGGKWFRKINVPAAAVVTTVAVALAYSVSFFPAIGEPTAPAVSSIDPAGNPAPYAQFVGADVGIPNAVAAVLVVYRNLDTFGEAVVAFTAVVGVLVVLRRNRMVDGPRECRRDRDHPELENGRNQLSGGHDTDESDIEYPDPYVMSPVVTTAIRTVVPLVFVFGVYLTLHGTVSPAGGFQGGVVVGSAFVLVGLAFGLGPTIDWVDERLLVAAMAGGVGLFVSVAFGAVAVTGTPFDVLAYAEATPLAVELIEVGIGLLIGGVVTTLVVVLAAGLKDDPGDAGHESDGADHGPHDSNGPDRLESAKKDREGGEST